MISKIYMVSLVACLSLIFTMLPTSELIIKYNQLFTKGSLPKEFLIFTLLISSIIPILNSVLAISLLIIFTFNY